MRTNNPYEYMKTLLCGLVAACLMSIGAHAATTYINEHPTTTELQDLLSLDPAFIFHVESGGETFRSEMSITTGNGTSYAEHNVWQESEQVGLNHDAAGNLTGWLGDTQLVDQPVNPFNTLIIVLSDSAIFGPTEYKNGQINGISFRNMFADDNDSGIPTSDYIVVHNVDEFNSLGFFERNEWGALTESKFEIIGVYSIPEPSSFVLLLFALVPFLIFRKRPACHRAGLFSFNPECSHIFCFLRGWFALRLWCNV